MDDQIDQAVMVHRLDTFSQTRDSNAARVQIGTQAMHGDARAPRRHQHFRRGRACNRAVDGIAQEHKTVARPHAAERLLQRWRAVDQVQHRHQQPTRTSA